MVVKRISAATGYGYAGKAGGRFSERRREGKEGRGGDGEVPSTTSLNCSLAVWAEGRVNGEFAATWKMRCEELSPRSEDE